MVLASIAISHIIGRIMWCISFLTYLNKQ